MSAECDIVLQSVENEMIESRGFLTTQRTLSDLKPKILG